MLDGRVKELEEKLAQSEANVIEFEALAHEWKLAHRDLSFKYKRDVSNLEIRVSELESDLRQMKKAPEA